jgi:hypothetical protein
VLEVVCDVHGLLGLPELVEIYLVEGLLCADFYADCQVSVVGGQTHADYLALPALA